MSERMKLHIATLLGFIALAGAWYTGSVFAHEAWGVGHYNLVVIVIVATLLLTILYTLATINTYKGIK